MAANNKEFEAKSIIARMQRIDKWPLPPSFLAIIAIGYFFTFYDVTDIGFAMPAIAPQFHLTGSESLFLALSIGLIGYVIGSFIIGYLSDRYGRYPMLILTMALMALGSFGDAASLNLDMLIIFRFITGLGLGADLNLIPAYIGEFAPADRRGHLAQITFFLGILGQAVTPFVALAIVPPFYFGWRLLFFIGGLIAVIAVILRAQLPRSPRWLVSHGELNKADDVVSHFEQYLKQKGEELPALTDDEINKINVKTETTRLSFYYLWQKPYRLRMLVFGLWWGLWYIGNYAFLGDAATILSDSGISLASSILYLAIGAIGYPVGALSSWVISDKIERKYIVFIGSILWLIGMVIFGSRINSIALISGSFIASYSLAFLIGIAYMYTSESYPTRARTSGFAMGDGLGHIGGAIGALYLPLWVAQIGFFGGFTFIGITTFIAGIILVVGGSIATRQHLETISA
ncbi:MFS transporter [Acidiplasma sp.]|uniref:MFS transporter n=1 Tax=Acidiplasma sp. TaxID=1872114 RepID=UPI0025827394|nr:MFS transporter [Acidiplasma sp.]